MEDGGLGNIIFYVILAVIGLVGSISNSKKKKAGGTPQKSFKWPDIAEKSVPPVRAGAERTPEKVVRPADAPIGQARDIVRSDDNSAAKRTMAGSFSQEGNYVNPLAERFSKEGSVENALASRFNREGRYENQFARSFAAEGSSSIGDIADFSHEDIADEQISDIEQFDYNAVEKSDQTIWFDLKKAVIYSALLDRKEYKF